MYASQLSPEGLIYHGFLLISAVNAAPEGKPPIRKGYRLILADLVTKSTPQMRKRPRRKVVAPQKHRPMMVFFQSFLPGAALSGVAFGPEGCGKCGTANQRRGPAAPQISGGHQQWRPQNDQRGTRLPSILSIPSSPQPPSPGTLVPSLAAGIQEVPHVDQIHDVDLTVFVHIGL